MPTMRKLILVTIHGVTCEDGWTPNEVVRAADDLQFIGLTHELLERAAECCHLEGERCADIPELRKSDGYDLSDAADLLRGGPSDAALAIARREAAAAKALRGDT